MEREFVQRGRLGEGRMESKKLEKETEREKE